MLAGCENQVGLSCSNQSTITGGNEDKVDVVLIQPFLPYYVNHVVLMPTGIF